MVIAFIVIVICAYIGIKTVFVEDKEATVPSMVGMQLVNAVEALQKEGLLAKVDQVDSPERADTVVSQNLPADEKVPKGKVVILRVSKGGAVMPMPDVRGLKFEEGVKRLNDAGFKVDKVLRVTDKLKPAGSIIAQNPAAPQQVAANCMVKLLVSTGNTGDNTFVRVPNLMGQNIDVVKQVLEQIGLTLGTTEEVPSSSVPAGTVLSTRPQNGANVPAGTLVNIAFARAPAPGEETADIPPANDQDSKKAAVVRTVVIKDTEPSQIPSKITEKVETAKPDQAPKPAAPKPVETKKTDEIKPAQTAQTAQTVHVTSKKTAKLRYQVPPLTKPLSLKIEINDASGNRVLRDGMAGSGEYVSMNVPYSGEAVITIYLGGDFVWQDRFN
jgi:serine/threonine-protein kinase